MNTIKLLVLDVDGTLTDGCVYMGATGEMMKAFHAKDGVGIKLLQDNGIEIAIITGRRSEILLRRAEELNIKKIVQNTDEKLPALIRLCEEMGISLSETGYMGDDLNDYAAMKACGLSACPADAAPEIAAIANFKAEHEGGHGAVRDFAYAYLSEKDLWASLAYRHYKAEI